MPRLLAMMRLLKDDGDVWGEKRGLFSDFTALAYPVYLSVLVDKACTPAYFITSLPGLKKKLCLDAPNLCSTGFFASHSKCP